MDYDTWQWTDHPANPLISPKWPDWLIADPTVLLPQETPDGRWHLFANSMPRLHHFTSSDGVAWKHIGPVLNGAIRPFIRAHEGEYYLFYERLYSPFHSAIGVKRSSDLKRWSREQIVLKPSLPWHGRFVRTCSCPCVVPWNGEFLLYYSANVVVLPDCLFFEPRHVGVARSSRFGGPFTPDPEPCISPDGSDPNRNMGAGAIKVIPDPERGLVWGFNNGIHRDARGRSRSCIMVIKSRDGVNWDTRVAPILAPEKSGWKKALVYALDVRLTQTGEAYLYYNARDGWLRGIERIGLCVGTLGGQAMQDGDAG